MPIRKEGKELFHEQLHSILLDQIREGTLAPGQKIPSERELSELYSVSRTTAKAAVLRLHSDGLVVRATGKGTFIADDVNDRRLASVRTGNIGLVVNKRRSYRVPLTEDAVYLALSQSVHSEVLKNGMHMMTAVVDDEDVQESKSYKNLLEKVDGVIVAEARSMALGDLARARKRPVVYVSPSDSHAGFDTVDIDNEHAGALATRYVLTLGHRAVGFIRGPSAIGSALSRLHGYMTAIEEAGLELHEQWIADADGWTVDDGARAARMLIAQAKELTAVVCSNDLLALGAMRAFRALGRDVPAAVSIIGCDNIELGQHSDPALTTLDTHIYSIGRVATQRLVQRMEGDDGPPQRILFPVSVVERETCAAF